MLLYRKNWRFINRTTWGYRHLVFSSLFFLYFFLPVLLLIYFISKNTTYRNWILILFSFAFYAWGEPVWIVLLVCMAFLGYLAALAIEKLRGKWQGKMLFILAICLNVGILGFFKYAGFFVENLNLLLDLHMPHPNIGLPIGISFFTFEIICYMTDVYKGALKAPTSPKHMLLYVSFFPHLIAGPIIRFVDIEHQMENRSVTLSGFSQGINRFMIGLGKKVILANFVGESVPALLGSDGGPGSFLGAWLGIVMFALQIYFDFSGYSDMAIGLGKMFGFTLKENFDYPYISKSATEFWRRWNMSLGSFFRDYVYIPLGGNRKYYIRNLFVVWFLTGFWHGASWNFILWGLYFGLLILLERLFISKLLAALPGWLSHVYLLLAMLLGWVWFYFTDLRQALHTFRILLGFSGKPLLTTEVALYFRENLILLVVAVIAATPLMKWLFQWLSQRFQPFKPEIYGVFLPVYNAAVLTIATILLVGSTYNPFLYFRF
jgi:alginate O-acetyltransferase complex protein AlgI